MRRRTEQVLADIAANVRRLRLGRKLTQQQLAEAAGYEVRLIQYVEAGERNLTIDSLVAVADALGAGAHELIAPAAHKKELKERRRGRPAKT